MDPDLRVKLGLATLIETVIGLEGGRTVADRLLKEVLEARTPDRSARPGSSSEGPGWLETLDAIASAVDVRDSEDLILSTNGIFR